MLLHGAEKTKKKRETGYTRYRAGYTTIWTGNTLYQYGFLKHWQFTYRQNILWLDGWAGG